MSKKRSVISVWECVCDKCGYRWKTRDEGVPKLCPKCKTKKWDVVEEAVSEPETLTKPVPTSLMEVDTRPKVLPERPVNEWQGWSEERSVYDEPSGEMVYYRQHVRTGKRREAKRETFYG